MNKEELYKMKLHETLHLGESVIVLRVPGGWIYTTYCDMKPSSVFVRFDNEFMGIESHTQK